MFIFLLYTNLETTKLPSHKKYAEDMLIADRMNVRPGGKQPVMHDAVFDGQVQSLILPDGQPKGMKLVLEE